MSQRARRALLITAGIIAAVAVGGLALHFLIRGLIAMHGG
jgi:hypothetical protein